MATAVVTVQRADHIPDFNKIFGELAQAHMEVACAVIKGAVQRNSPVNLGTFRAGISTQVLEQVLDVGSSIKGSVFSQDDPIKVNVIEEGRAPGTYAPVGVITRWVQLVIHPPANKLRSIAFLVNRKIFEWGIKGKHVFQRSFEETKVEVDKILNADLSEALAARL